MNTSRLQRTQHAAGNGKRAETGKLEKNGRKIEKGPTARNGERMAQKFEKMGFGIIFPSFRQFWAIFSQSGPCFFFFFIFLPSFSHFPVSARFPFSTRESFKRVT